MTAEPHQNRYSLTIGLVTAAQNMPCEEALMAELRRFSLRVRVPGKRL